MRIPVARTNSFERPVSPLSKEARVVERLGQLAVILALLAADFLDRRQLPLGES
jgi:hypothetical protein